MTTDILTTNKSIIKVFLGFLVIIALLAGYWIYSDQALTGTKPYYRDADPEMAYFMNSLATFKGHSYFYADHPGTPVEILGTLLLGLTYPFFPDVTDFIRYHIQNPRLFLDMAHILVTIFSITCATFFFSTAIKSLQQPNTPAALILALMFYGLHPYSFTTLTIWSHTAFNFPMGTLYLLILFRVAHNREPITKRLAMGLGLTTGVMIATMINFLPWLITTIVFIAVYYRLQNISWMHFLTTAGIVLAFSAIGFFLSILPAVSRMFYFIGFIQRLINHQLTYGNGEEGITTIPLLFENFLILFKTYPALFLSMFLSINLTVYLLFQQRHRISDEPGKWALSIALLIQDALLILFVLKHPGDRFLLPLAATLPVSFLLILVLSEYDPLFHFLLYNALVVSTTVGIFYFGIVSLRQKKVDLIQTQSFETQVNLALEEQAKLTSNPHGEMFILWTNLTYSYCSSRLSGDYYTSGALASEVGELCPNQAYFFFNQNWVIYHGKPTTLDTLPWDILVTRTEMLAGNPSWKERSTVWEYPHELIILRSSK